MSTPVPSAPVPGSGWDRRTLLKTGLAAATVAGGPFAGFVNLASAAVFTADPTADLVEVPDERDGQVRLRVPEGFRYRSFHDTDVAPGADPVTLPDGTVLPGRHDGMGAFPGANGGPVTLVRNHEVGRQPEPAIGPADLSYDAMAPGGTTTLVVDAKSRALVRDFVSLSGTLINCAGGPTPWGSWISCEETVAGVNNGFARPHGYCFEVAASQNGPSVCRPLTAMELAL